MNTPTIHPDTVHPLSPAPASDLGQLVVAEEDLERRLAQAKEEAGALLEAARREAQESSRNHHERNSRLVTEAEARFSDERRREEARILTDGKARAAWYDELTETTVATLAEAVLDQLLREEPE